MKKRIIAMVISVITVVSLMSSAMAADSANAVVRLNPANASPFNGGIFQGWGTSMGWWGNRIGYSDKLAQDAAELFYSENGLGLDIVRYNVGGGDDPAHNHVTRSDSKMPCFLNEDGTYDWEADHNQVNVLKRIKAENPDVHIEGYTNSPPWFMTNSKCSGGGVNSGENLDPSKYADFAKFLADVAEHFEEVGLKFNSYSPMNEPSTQTNYWGANSVKQEGNHVAPGEHQSGVINAVSDEFDKRGIDTLVVGLDETSIDYSITSFKALNDKAKSNLDRLDTHSYGGSKRAELKQTAIDAGKNLWMSEVDHGGTAGTNSGNMGMAFDLANYILNDVNGMQPSAWVLWDILDFHKDSSFTDPNGNKTEANNALNQNGGLWGVGMVNHDTEQIELTQKYYAYGQFTKYIKPGMTIISSAPNTLAAYNKSTGDIAIVAVNSSDKDVTTEFDLRAFVNTGSSAKVIRTSGAFDGGEHWAELPNIAVEGKEFTTALKGNSITTFVIENDNVIQSVIDTFETTSEGLTYSYTAPNFTNAHQYFVVYDSNGVLKTVKIDKPSGTIEGDFTGCTGKVFVWNGMAPASINYMAIEGASKAVVGNTYNYRAVIGPEAVETPITWSVSDESVASVDADGKLTPIGDADIVLTATAEELGISTSMDVTVFDPQKHYADKYKDTNYEFVSNISEATNDFEEDKGSFVTSGSAMLTSDGGNPAEKVLGVQANYSNKDGKAETGSAVLTPAAGWTCEENQIINIAFDIYCSNSGGTAGFTVYGDEDKELVKMTVHDWDKYTMTVAGTATEEADGAKKYLRNGVNDKMPNQLIKNGGHVEIYYMPSSGDITVTVKGISNSYEQKTYTRNITGNSSVSKIGFEANYTTWSKPMYVDNLLTNIITSK